MNIEFGHRILQPLLLVGWGAVSGCLFITEADWARFDVDSGSGGSGSGTPSMESTVDGSGAVEDFFVSTVDAGQYTVGSSGIGSNPAIDPERTIELTHGFEFGQSEVLQSTWLDVMGGRLPDNVDANDHAPIHWVSWHDAAAFTVELTDRMNQSDPTLGLEVCFDCDRGICTARFDPITNCSGYRLPTEVEWEVGAKSGGGGDFWGGLALATDTDRYNCETDVVLDDSPRRVLSDVAWYCIHNPDGGPFAVSIDSSGSTAILDGFLPAHVSGNVAEWVADAYRDAPPEGSDPYVAPAVGSDAERMVVRGGSWTDDPVDVRLSARASQLSATPSSRIGFRVARTLR